MRIETILNHCYRHKSFVYTGCRLKLIGGRNALVVEIEPRKNGLTECSICGKACPIYDHMADYRQFEFIPLWNIPVYFRYTMRRVDCKDCGIRVERVPWAEGKSPVTKSFALFLARWARKLSWKETAEGYDEEVLKHTKYCFLKNEGNLTEKQQTKLADVLQYDLKSVRAYLLKESFQLFWNYNSPYWAEWYLLRILFIPITRIDSISPRTRSVFCV